MKNLFQNPHKIMKLGRFITAFLIFIMSYFIWGCATTVTTEYYPVYKDVLVPVPCKINLPNKPNFQGIPVIDNLNIMKYTKELGTAITECGGGIID